MHLEDVPFARPVGGTGLLEYFPEKTSGPVESGQPKPTVRRIKAIVFVAFHSKYQAGRAGFIVELTVTVAS